MVERVDAAEFHRLYNATSHFPLEFTFLQKNSLHQTRFELVSSPFAISNGKEIG
jgi:hypothetical protein